MTSRRRFGRYETRRVLGRGGMGVVYEAVDPLIGRTVAIKEIRIDHVRDADERAELESRFELEFQAAGGLSHPNIVTIYDVGKEEGSYFVAMEYVAGASLGERLDQGPTLTAGQVDSLGSQIAAGLDYAHGQGIVHRDVKPANVLLGAAETPKLTDFGLVKLMSTDLTTTGTLLGTPAFMSPEQVTAAPVDRRSDQFALAVMLYLMLTGETPFRAPHPSAVLYKIVHEAPAPMGRLGTPLPEAIQRVILRGLAKEPDQRYPDCRALASDLSRVLPSLDPPSLGINASSRVDDDDWDNAGPTRTFGPEAEGILDFELTPSPGSESEASREADSASETTVPGVAGPRAAGSQPGDPRRAEGVPSLRHAAAVSGRPPVRLAAVLWTLVLGAAAVAAGVGAFLSVGQGPAAPPSAVASEGEIASDAGAQPEGASADPVPGFGDAEGLVGESVPGSSPSPRSAVGESDALTLEVTSQPPGARILLGGEDTGAVTPAEVNFRSDAPNSLSLSLDGHVGAGWTFEASDLRPEQLESGLHFPLRRDVEPGWVDVTADYPVTVRIGGRRFEEKLEHGIELPPGSHRVELVAEGVFLRETWAVEVESGKRSSLRAPRSVPVRIAANPANCRLSIDGRFVDVTPINDRSLVVGRHRFEFHWPAEDRSRVIEVVVNRSGQRIFANLAP
ncbi:MAG: protein kinase [Acidobacteriota bacterium]